MKQLSNNTTINKEINYSVIKTMNIKTLTDEITINYSTNIIDFYTKTLNEYLPLNGYNLGIDKVSEIMQTNYITFYIIQLKMNYLIIIICKIIT